MIKPDVQLYEMPKSCQECPFKHTIDVYGSLYLDDCMFARVDPRIRDEFKIEDLYLPKDRRLKSCPLVEEEKESSRIEKVLHGKTPEEQYDYIDTLLHDYGRRFIDSRLAVIDWLSGKEVNK